MACEKFSKNKARPPHILIVEDDTMMSSLISDVLAPVYSISLAETAESALEKSYQELPDLILCDIKLPDGSGLNILQKLKQDEITAHIPILVISSLNTPEDIITGLEHGADDYIPKPFLIDELLHRVQNRLQNCERIISWCRNQMLANKRFESAGVLSKEQLFLEKLRITAEALLHSGNLSIDTLASEMAHSKRQLQRKVREYLNCSCSNYIFGLLMNFAENLQSKGYTIKEISSRTGYKDAAHFSRIFKKYLDQKYSQKP